MEHNKAEFYKLFLNELQRKKSKNSSDAKAFEEKLFSLIGNDLDNSARLGKIEEQVNRVANKFDVIDKETEKRARYFYKDFPATTPVLNELKVALTKSYEFYDYNLKKEDHKQSAKYSIVQLEGVLNYLEQNLIAWIEEDESRNSRLGSKIKIYRNGSRGLNFYDKCWVAKEYVPIKYFSSEKINLVYDIRNYESHQFLSEQARESENKLLLLKSSPSDYYNEVFSLIKNCFSVIR